MQTQRLSIARGVINEQCRLLLLDEPTSAVDGPTETKIMGNLAKIRQARGCGQVMVAHRMSTLTKCDSIIFMINPAKDALSAVELDNDRWLGILINEHQCDLNTVDLKGRTLLEVAVASRRPKCEELLQRLGASRGSGSGRGVRDVHGARVGEQGTHADLVARKGLYSDFYHEMMKKELV